MSRSTCAAYKARVIELLGARCGGLYLDVGAGTGDDARSVSEKIGATVVGVDLSQTMTLEVRDPTAVDNVMGLKTWARSALSAGDMSEAEATTWEKLYDETIAAGRFRYAVTFFLTSGARL